MGIKVSTKTQKIKEYFCDECGKRTGFNNICIMCKKYLCSKCIVFDDRDYGDYPDRYCQKCWEIGRPYRLKIAELEQECDEKIEELQNNWEKIAELREVAKQ